MYLTIIDVCNIVALYLLGMLGQAMIFSVLVVFAWLTGWCTVRVIKRCKCSWFRFNTLFLNKFGRYLNSQVLIYILLGLSVLPALDWVQSVLDRYGSYKVYVTIGIMDRMFNTVMFIILASVMFLCLVSLFPKVKRGKELRRGTRPNHESYRRHIVGEVE